MPSPSAHLLPLGTRRRPYGTSGGCPRAKRTREDGAAIMASTRCSTDRTPTRHLEPCRRRASLLRRSEGGWLHEAVRRCRPSAGIGGLSYVVPRGPQAVAPNEQPTSAAPAVIQPVASAAQCIDGSSPD